MCAEAWTRWMASQGHVAECSSPATNIHRVLRPVGPMTGAKIVLPHSCSPSHVMGVRYMRVCGSISRSSPSRHAASRQQRTYRGRPPRK